MPYREPSPPPDVEALARAVRERVSLRRARFLVGAAAIVIPSFFFLLFERQARRLEALADHGVRVDATVTSSRSKRYTTYEYAYATHDELYSWSVPRHDAPFERGASVPIWVLPESPSLSRLGKTGDAAAAEAAHNRRFFPKALAVMFTFFALGTAFLHRRLVVLERKPLG